jgi:DNA mismatch endonuclease, patch repair protein
MPQTPRALPKSEAVRRRLSLTGRRDTKPERVLRSELHRRGLRYRVDAPLPGLTRRRADLVFPREQVAVFVDGCFWHRCPKHWNAPLNNAEFWASKIDGNVRRDRDTNARLTDAGWTVVRVWEHEDPREAADRVEAAVRVTGRR